MAEPDEAEIQKAIDYWNCEALIAEEEGDAEQAERFFRKAEELSSALRTSTDSRP